MAVTVDQRDPRYEAFSKGHNLCWPSSPSQAARSIEICENDEDVVSTLQRIIDSGRRPTIRSGGHCYEDFVVNNPGGSILDLSLLTASQLPGDAGRFRISAGKQLGDAYLDLFKRHNVTLPGGSCYTVGAGGHISGGGYGLLSRLHGLSVDWLSAVDIVTVNSSGRAQLLRVDKAQHPDLFRACRGAGGGNFGIITAYLFDKLPTPPTEVVTGGISFDWSSMSESRFVDILQTYGEYCRTRGTDSETWGLFSALHLSHSSADKIGVGFQFCNPDGTASDLCVVNEFLDRFNDFNASPEHSVIRGDRIVPQKSSAAKACPGPHALTRQSWLDVTVGGGGGRGGSRAKYKSAHMKDNFTLYEAKCLYKHLTRPVKHVNLHSFVLAVDSFGGAVNRPGLVAETSSQYRSSNMKLQFMSFWNDPKDDSGIQSWMQDLYTDLYSGDNVPSQFKGTPYPGNSYEGCYINYPDKDMLAHPFWPQLYYGTGDLYPFLQGVKQSYDPHNIFHHAMSVRPGQA